MPSSLLSPDFPPALLVLADGTVFHGYSIGADGIAVGELVFNTAMTGYQEILTDPSYCRQLVTLTAAQIGNTGVNGADDESDRLQAEALIVKALPVEASSWRRGVAPGSSENTLISYLKQGGKPGICGVDTRKLTRLLRDRGAQSACLIAGSAAQGGGGPLGGGGILGGAVAGIGPVGRDTGPVGRGIGPVGRDACSGALDDDAPVIQRALAAARAFPGLAGMDLARVVSTAEPYAWLEGSWSLDGGYARPAPEALSRHVVVLDFGVKRNILRLLVDRGCRITVVPAMTNAAAVAALRPDGLLLANGPGDPEPCDYAIATVRELIAQGYPTFGICLGHQILALASGARTMKMKFGHHGANHPVKELATGRVSITSQNHGFAVDPESIASNLRVTHRSLFDGSIQGLERVDRPAFSFQGHPEASPGPQDIGYLFDRFVARLGRGEAAQTGPAGGRNGGGGTAGDGRTVDAVA